jgi:hypothetical protein
VIAAEEDAGILLLEGDEARVRTDAVRDRKPLLRV